MAFTRLVAVAAIGAGLTACAQPSKEIKAVYVDPGVYASYDCNTLEIQRQALGKALDAALRRERDAYYSQYSWVVPIEQYKTASDEDRVAALKGHSVALSTTMRERSCSTRLAGGVASGAVWAINPTRAAAAQRTAAPFQTPNAASD